MQIQRTVVVDIVSEKSKACNCKQQRILCHPRPLSNRSVYPIYFTSATLRSKSPTCFFFGPLAEQLPIVCNGDNREKKYEETLSNQLACPEDDGVWGVNKELELFSQHHPVQRLAPHIFGTDLWRTTSPTRSGGSETVFQTPKHISSIIDKNDEQEEDIRTTETREYPRSLVFPSLSVQGASIENMGSKDVDKSSPNRSSSNNVTHEASFHQREPANIPGSPKPKEVKAPTRILKRIKDAENRNETNASSDTSLSPSTPSAILRPKVPQISLEKMEQSTTETPRRHNTSRSGMTARRQLKVLEDLIRESAAREKKKKNRKPTLEDNYEENIKITKGECSPILTGDSLSRTLESRIARIRHIDCKSHWESNNLHSLNVRDRSYTRCTEESRIPVVESYRDNRSQCPKRHSGEALSSCTDENDRNCELTERNIKMFDWSQHESLNEKEKDQVARKWFKFFNKQVFKNRLPENLSLVWNNKLTRTAGQTNMVFVSNDESKKEKHCTIQLSCKVLDNEEKLKSTLLHELCHVAQFLLENERKPAHGPGFQRWARIATASCPQYPVSVTHDYEINTPYNYQCDECSRLFGRFSKIKDLKHARCSSCGGAIRTASS